jgi:hypothetical protein
MPDKFLNSNLFKKSSASFGSLKLISNCTGAKNLPIAPISSHMVAGNTVLRDGKQEMVVQIFGTANQFFFSPEGTARLCFSCSVGVGDPFSEVKSAGA